MLIEPSPPSEPRGRETAAGIFLVFLGLGMRAFGGPVAHLAWFREAFVLRRRWLDEAAYAHLLSLCQLLPGPASSQLGFAIGWLRGGWRGALAAFLGFSLPSLLLMFGFAHALPLLRSAMAQAVLHGLKLTAVAAVAHALLGMGRALRPRGPSLAIATLTAAIAILLPGALTQLLALAGGALAGRFWLGASPVDSLAASPIRIPALLGRWALAVYLGLLVAAFLVNQASPGPAAVAAAFYRSGALVFGGGHVVLPLLRTALVRPGWLDDGSFLAGYGAAQVMPGPMFSLATFLGSRLGNAPVLNATLATAGIFLPGFLLLLAALPFWSKGSTQPGAAAAIAGLNATVVGLLGAAFVDPVLRQGIREPTDVLIASLGLLWLLAGRSALLAIASCLGAVLLRAASSSWISG